MLEENAHFESINHNQGGRRVWSGISGIFSLYDGLVFVCFSATLLIWQLLASLQLNLSLILFDLLFPPLALLAGRVPLIALKLPASRGFSQAGAFVGGIVLLNLAMLATTLIFRLSAAGSFIICAASIILVSLVTLRFLPQDSIRNGAGQACSRDDHPAFANLLNAAPQM
jgi:hypothetical protein